MAYTEIDKPSATAFNTKLYTGNGSTQSITGVGFQPDWLWIKSRSQSVNHYGFDVVRGVTKGLSQNTNSAESTKDSTWVSSFDSDGFSLGSEANINNSSSTYVSWNWKAGGTASSNSNGSITSSVSANTDAGFSIVTYTGTGSNATVGHGLGVAPNFVIVKDRDNAVHWVISGDTIGWDKNLYISDGSARQTANHFQDQAPTSSAVYLATDVAVNGSSRNYVMYCFAQKKGYSSFGKYRANDQDGDNSVFVYTGFKPALVWIKQINATRNWMIMDNKREGYNDDNDELHIQNTDTENTGDTISMLSNGFKLQNSTGDLNYQTNDYLYFAWAENPFVSSTGIPTTSR